MRTRVFFGAAAAATLPFAVSAATLSPDNNIDAGGSYDVADAPFQWNASFDDGETETGVFGQSGLQFTFRNDTFSRAALTFAITTVNQFEDAISGTADYYFTGGLMASLDGDSISVPQGETDDFTLSTRIAPGESAILNFDFGEAVAEGGVGPDIDFRVTAAPIPVPAALPLLGAALGGLGWIGHRRKKA